MFNFFKKKEKTVVNNFNIIGFNTNNGQAMLYWYLEEVDLTINPNPLGVAFMSLKHPLCVSHLGKRSVRITPDEIWNNKNDLGDLNCDFRLPLAYVLVMPNFFEQDYSI